MKVGPCRLPGSNFDEDALYPTIARRLAAEHNVDLADASSSQFGDRPVTGFGDGHFGDRPGNSNTELSLLFFGTDTEFPLGKAW